MSATMELVKTKKELKAEKQREYYKANKEALAERRREYYKANKEAQAEYGREYYQANKEELAVKAQATNLMKKFGITKEEYNDMLYNQNGKCGCCGKHHTDEHYSLAVDHDHNTDAVRGLLCGNCNRAIGMLGDSIEGVQRALDYLLKSE